MDIYDVYMFGGLASKLEGQNKFKGLKTVRAQCFPLYSLLLAAGATTVGKTIQQRVVRLFGGQEYKVERIEN